MSTIIVGQTLISLFFKLCYGFRFSIKKYVRAFLITVLGVIMETEALGNYLSIFMC